eukprot:UN34132
MPPQIQTDGKQLSVHVHRLEKLPKMDKWLGSCDPYVKIKFAGADVKSRTENKVQSVDLDEQVLVPVFEPTMSKNILVQVYDEDLAQGDDLIGTWKYDYTKLKKFEVHKVEIPVPKGEDKVPPREFIKSPMYYVHLYGAPLGYQDGIADKMNSGYLEGSYYRGSML